MHLNLRRQILKDPWFITGVFLIVPMTVLALAGPVLVPFSPHDMSFTPLSPPGPDHWLGINDGGMDILSELLFGLRNTMIFGLTAGGAGLILGAALGLISAWKGGAADLCLMRLADIVLAVPAVMILILTAAFLQPSSMVLALVLAGMTWPTTARGVRAQALTLKHSLHIKAARRMGGSTVYIILRHLMPELFPLYLINFAAKIRMAIFMETSLAFLGLFDPSHKSLGLMISYALKYYYLNIWLNWLIPPILCLCLLIMGTTFMTISLEKIFDPRLKEIL